MPLRPLLASLCLLLVACGNPDAVHQFTRGMTQQPGLLPLYHDGETGKLYMAVPRAGQQYLYYFSLPQGLGSNDIGLDRGQLMDLDTKLVQFEDAGEKVLLRQLNTRFRAVSDNPPERQSVQDAFASAVLWGFPVVARNDSSLLLDATGFALRDSHGVARKLKALKQGEFQPDASRSALYMARTKAFPRNTEIEATVSFTGEQPGEFVQQVAADAHNLSLRLHHSFVALPDDNFSPRRFHPQSGFWAFEFRDYGAPIEAELDQRYVPRHRLHKKDPTAALSEAVAPIVYYLDPGVPEPIRGALLDGARWWNQAFEAAGYKDAFQVQLLPADADPLDVRYNVIQWVHRATRGWSYGYGLTDPRTGEIIKGHVTLGSLRVRQDYLIAQGMTSPFTGADADTAPLTDLALARIRQLSAHEVGHTLGIAHNFAASNKDRASVMDYPHPLLEDQNGKISLSQAYAENIGDWDKRVIQYGYGDFANDAERLAFVDESSSQGFAFISDPDSRSLQDPHAASSLWDNGADAVAELQRVMALRQQALKNFGAASLAEGRPWSELAEILVPVYYYHRYQAEAAGKWLGGYDYNHALKGQALRNAPVAAADQRRALQALLQTLSPAYLDLPDGLAALIPPKAYGYSKSRESPPAYTGAVFDPLTLAEASANHSFDILLNPERQARLYWQKQSDPQLPDGTEILAGIWSQLDGRHGRQQAIAERLQISLLNKMRGLLAADKLAPEQRGEWAVFLHSINADQPDRRQGHSLLLEKLIGNCLGKLADVSAIKPAAMPPGSPI